MIRLAAEHLRTLLDGWQHPEIALRAVQPEETEVAADLILDASREIRTLTDASLRGTRDSCTAAIAAGNAFLFVEHRGVPAGVLRGELYSATQGGSQFYISHISVRPQLRSVGLGSLLMGHLEGWARGMGACAMTLDFMADNRRVEPFYRRLGYEVVGYDLLRRLEANHPSVPTTNVQASSSSPSMRTYEPPDLSRVLAFLRGRQGLCTFEQPFLTESDVAARLHALGTDPQQRLCLLERDGTLAGLCWSLLKLNRSGAAIVIAISFESDDLESATVLLETLKGLALENTAVASYVTLWEPCGGRLELSLAQGYAFGRYKLRKHIGSGQSAQISSGERVVSLRGERGEPCSGG